MQQIVRMLAVLVGMAGLIPSAQASDAGIAYIVTYFEVSPKAKDQTVVLLRQLSRHSRGDAGNLRFEVMQRLDQSDQFVMLEAWKDKDAQAAHAATDHKKQFRDKLQGLLRSAYDERPHVALEVGEVRAAPVSSAIFVVTHVDIVPKDKDTGVTLTKGLAAAGRKYTSNVRFEVLTQANRPNHMTVVEIWADRKAFELHSIAPHMKQYREKLLPMSGSLYDERLYKALN